MAVTNIRSEETYLRSFWDWTPLNECFRPTKIRVSDIDLFIGPVPGVAERHGQFLWIETKRPNEQVERGQAIMHDALLATGLFTILIIWGEVNDPQRYRLRWRAKYRDVIGGWDEIVAAARRWFLWAEGKAT